MPAKEHGSFSGQEPAVQWPDGHRFAFTVIDDPDAQTLEEGRQVYRALSDHGLRTTKAVWPLAPIATPSDHGGTCGDPAYREWCRSLQQEGFEIGLHGVRPHTSDREATIAGLEAFGRMFGGPPGVFVNHYFNRESLYWGPARLSGWRRAAYTLATRGRNPESEGHQPGSRLFWGDFCREQVRYVRNFVFQDIDSLAACPWMPYHDAGRPLVASWFSGSDGNNAEAFVRLLSRKNLDRLEQSGGACIVYTHFGHGFVRNGRLVPGFLQVLEEVARRPGWFAPVSTLLGFLATRPGHQREIPAEARGSLERRWLLEKLRHGTS